MSINLATWIQSQQILCPPTSGSVQPPGHDRAPSETSHQLNNRLLFVSRAAQREYAVPMVAVEPVNLLSYPDDGFHHVIVIVDWGQSAVLSVIGVACLSCEDVAQPILSVKAQAGLSRPADLVMAFWAVPML